MTSSRGAVPGTGTQSSCWGLPLFASIFENRKQISKVVGRDCAGVGWTLELLSAATSGSGVASFTFLLGNRTGSSARFNLLLWDGKISCCCSGVAGGSHKERLQLSKTKAHLHRAEIKEGDSPPWIFHMAFD